MAPAHTVLVVDDEPASLRAVQRALADVYKVLTAPSAVRALAVLDEQAVALVIADQRMAEMTGTELLAQCMLRHPDTIRVLLTGYTDIETLTDAINAGHVYHYLPKPWEVRELRLVVRRGLERYEAEMERQRLVRELEQAYARVRHEAEQKSRLLTTAAHELGTPVHLIMNSVAFIAEAELPADTRPWLDTAERGAQWLARSLAQMVRCARWRADGCVLRYAPVDLAALLSSLRSAFAPAIARRNLTLELRMPAQLPALVGDRASLETALCNLLSNAVRFTPDGGTVVLTAVDRGSAAVEIAVADTGIGLDPEVVDEVFEPFSAASGDLLLHASGGFEFGARGLGLGLAITKSIVERHGGAITVRSQLGAGTQFAITLPLQPRAEPPTGPRVGECNEFS